MGGIKWQWNDKALMEIAEQVATNLEIAAKFVETEAKGNLIGIQSPRSGRAYRQKVLARRIGHELERGARFVEARVGILRGKRQEYHGAYYIEIGTRKIPAHPWLRPAVFNNAREIVKLVSGR